MKTAFGLSGFNLSRYSLPQRSPLHWSSLYCSIALMLCACSGNASDTEGESKGESYKKGVEAAIEAALNEPVEPIRAHRAVLSRNKRPGVANQQGGGFANMQAWRNAFEARARASGIGNATLNRVRPLMVYQERVAKSDRNQAEFDKTTMGYVNSMVIPERYRVGKARWSRLGKDIMRIAQVYGVDESVLMGIWGMETNFGSFMGRTNVITSMSTLAYDGRRRNWAEKQLINALHIIQKGDIDPENMEGSWAAGMGHTQLIPEMYNIYAIDYTGDGRRDVWRPIDALASTANFLRNEGWRKGMRWGAEVQLPQGFDYSLTGKRNFRPAEFWRARGVKSLSSRGLPNDEFAIYIPEGAKGRAFGVTRNFEQIKRYNPALSYVLAVSVLGDVTLGYMEPR